MCGRFSLYWAPSDIEQEVSFRWRPHDAWQPRFNYAPSHNILTVAEDRDGQRIAGGLTWGMPMKGRSQLIFNARIETLAEKPLFKEKTHHRVVVLADGFYEWDHKTKKPFRIQPRQKRLWKFAAIWIPHVDRNRVVILTQPAQGPLQELHHRMPIILDDGNILNSWLDRNASFQTIQKHMASGEPAWTIFPVTPEVNRVAFNHPRAIIPLLDDLTTDPRRD